MREEWAGRFPFEGTQVKNWLFTAYLARERADYRLREPFTEQDLTRCRDTVGAIFNLLRQRRA